MTKRLFVGGLPYEIDDAQLKAMFAKFGDVVSANVIIDKFTQRSKGFAFVEMAKEEDAEKAMKELSDTEVGGRKIVVQEAKPMEERPPRRSFGDSRGGGYGRRDDNRRGGSGRGFQGKRW
jgi:RNA recognition motif-containing protein